MEPRRTLTYCPAGLSNSDILLWQYVAAEDNMAPKVTGSLILGILTRLAAAETARLDAERRLALANLTIHAVRARTSETSLAKLCHHALAETEGPHD